MIVVTGAGGHVGGLIAAELSSRGVPFRAVTRTIERLPDLAGAEVALAGYDEPDTLEGALEPGDRVFMVSMHEPPERRIPLHRGFVDAAVRRRVGRIVYLSFVGADPKATFLHARSHGATEAMLAESGIPFTAVRNGMYADEIASWFDSEGRITGPGGDGRVSFSYRPELAEAIVDLLVDPANDGRPVLTITGPEAITLSELATIASEVTGDHYRYAPLDRDAWIAYRRFLGRPEWSIEAGISYYDGVVRGEAGLVSGDYRALTGKEPLPIRDVIALRRDGMPLASVAASTRDRQNRRES
jgi:NAD(P)H dehydrogenase (quinone)